MTPTELAVEIWGRNERWSRSPGARRIRMVARELFPESAPGQGGEWDLTDDQAMYIREWFRGERSISRPGESDFGSGPSERSD